MHLPELSHTITCLAVLTGMSVASPILLNEWSWTDGNGLLHEYQVMFSPRISWEDAHHSLEADWHLATITSEEEQESLISGLNQQRGEFWLGGHQSEIRSTPENSWEWENGEAWNYTNWAPGEPNDFYGSASEQYVAVWSRWGSDWKWNDEGYLPNISGFVTERFQAVPEPSSLSLLLFNGVILTGFIIRKKRGTR